MAPAPGRTRSLATCLLGLAAAVVAERSRSPGRLAPERAPEPRFPALRRSLSRVALLLSATGARGQEQRIARPDELIKILDKDLDGFVDLDEYLSMAKRSMDKEGKALDDKSLPWYTRLFNGADIEGDGLLSGRECEFMGFLAKEALALGIGTSYDEENPHKQAEVYMSELEQTFMQLDRNGDGSVDLAEYLAATLRLADSHDWPPALTGVLVDWLRVLFRRADITRDGDLNRQEARYMNFLVQDGMQKGMIAKLKVVESLFQSLDKNRDSFLDSAELNSVAVVAGKDLDKADFEAHRQQLLWDFEFADTDGDGRLTKQEAISVATNLLERAGYKAS